MIDIEKFNLMVYITEIKPYTFEELIKLSTEELRALWEKLILESLI